MRNLFSWHGSAIVLGKKSGYKITHQIATLAVFLLLWQITLMSGWAEAYDYTAARRPKDNFLEASFRLAVPSLSSPLSSVLVYIPGTDGDGRGVISDPKFLKLADACHAAVLGCYYRGEGLPYQDPRGGSGRALDEALGYFSVKTGMSEIAKAKFLIVGFSEGGIFTFNYVCWHPERVKAFAALRAVFPCAPPTDESFNVPGVLAAGEMDEPGRIRAIANAFNEANGKANRWSFLFEKQSAHEMGRSFDFASSFFQAVCDDSSASFIRIDTLGADAKAPLFDAGHSSWFPSQTVANLWKEIDQPIPWEELVHIADLLSLRDFLTLDQKPRVYACDNGSCQIGALRIDSRSSDITIGRLIITGEGFRLQGPITGKLPEQLRIEFAPKNMAWGEAHGDVKIDGYRAGHFMRPVHASLYGTVTGPVTPIPEVAYLGVIVPGQSSDKTILLRSSEIGVHFSAIDSPEGVTVNLGAADNQGDFPLSLHWVGGRRLGRMEGQVTVSVASPVIGTVRIPILGFVLPPDGYASNVDCHFSLSVNQGIETLSRVLNFLE